MKLKETLLLGAGLAAACTCTAGKNNAQMQKKKQTPNILLFIADDCTYHDIACYGGKNSKTPNIDRFATEGMLFNRAFQAAPMSAPTRSNLYTGIYPVKSGAYPNHCKTNPGIKSIVHYLKPLGYDVALLGKRHITPESVYPFNYIGKAQGEMDFKLMDQFLSQYQSGDKNFCLFACSHEPHSPHNKGNAADFPKDKLILPPYWVDTDETRDEYSRYLAEVAYMDWQFGQCLELLKKYNLDENTLVVFTSEQGNDLPFAKWTCYGNGLQTGFIVRYADMIKAGSKSNAMIEYCDVVPTFVEVAGGTPDKALDGKSFLPVLKGKTDKHKNYVFGLQTSRGIFGGPDYYGSRTVRSEKYRFILNLTPEAQFKNITINNQPFTSWKAKAKTDPEADVLVQKYLYRPAEELYDVEKDPYEMNNLANDPACKKIKEDLKKQLQAWMKNQGDLGQATEMDALKHSALDENKNQKEESGNTGNNQTKKKKKQQ